MASVAFTAKDIPRDVTLVVWSDSTVWVNHGPNRTRSDRLDVFFEKIAECHRLRCLICNGRGYVTSGNDGGECYRCEGARFNTGAMWGAWDTKLEAQTFAVELHRRSLLALFAEPDGRLRRDLYLADLVGHDVLCWCALGDPCHGDTLVDLANPEV